MDHMCFVCRPLLHEPSGQGTASAHSTAHQRICLPVCAVVKLWSGEVDASGELSGAGSFTAADFEPTAQMPVDELFGRHLGGFLVAVHCCWACK